MGIVNYMKSPLAILFIGCLFLLFCDKVQGNEMIAKKVPTILLNLLNSKDPVNFAKTHGIELKDGMVRVVMTVDESFSLKVFIFKYDLKDYQKRKNLITSYVTLDNLKELCKEPSIVFVRLPIKFNGMGKTSENEVETEK